MKAPKVEAKMISQSELGRRANVPTPKLLAAIRSGFEPDLIVCNGKVKLFALSRVAELTKLVSGNVPNIIA